MSPENIQSRFHKHGIFPLESNAKDKSSLRGFSTEVELSTPHLSDDDTSAVETILYTTKERPDPDLNGTGSTTAEQRRLIDIYMQDLVTKTFL